MTYDELTAAIYNALASDTSLTGQIATYAGNPAIFTGARVPEDAAFTYLHLEHVDSVSFDTKTHIGYRATRSLGLFQSATQSLKTLENLASLAKSILHRSTLSVASGTIVCDVTGPIPAPTGEGVTGLLLTLTMLYLE